MPTSASSIYVRQVAHALRHLYDPDVLRAHPLATALGLSSSPNTPAQLRQALIKSIESLKPNPAVPATSRSARVYKLLHLRYVQQLSQAQTAFQLGVGSRHLRREQQAALRVLAETLASQAHYSVAVSDQSTPVAEGDKASGNVARSNALESELHWLKAAPREVTSAPHEVLQAAIQLVASLAEARHVTIHATGLHLPPLDVKPAGLRQTLVTLLSGLIHRAPGGEVSFSSSVNEREATIEIYAQTGSAVIDNADAEAGVKIAQALLNADDGSLDVKHTDKTITMRVTLSVADTIKVGLIDDNPDIAQLAQRCLIGTRYRLIVKGVADELFAWMHEHQPHIIVLDVMMPDADGWELLGRLRQHPLTHALPVIICSVLPERDLALTLGASAYVPKPVTREALLQALDQMVSQSLEPH